MSSAQWWRLHGDTSSLGSKICLLRLVFLPVLKANIVWRLLGRVVEWHNRQISCWRPPNIGADRIEWSFICYIWGIHRGKHIIHWKPRRYASHCGMVLPVFPPPPLESPPSSPAWPCTTTSSTTLNVWSGLCIISYIVYPKYRLKSPLLNDHFKWNLSSDNASRECLLNESGSSKWEKLTNYTNCRELCQDPSNTSR